jgi:copper transport protein
VRGAARNAPAALVAVAAVALALPQASAAHAALVRTSPTASHVQDAAPRRVSLTYSESVEPRFAIVSVTDAAGRRLSAGAPRRSGADPNRIDVPLERLHEGWYLVFWRVVSADGHPVRGAFTFAVGPNPGPAPEFAVPSLGETAATVPLLIARFLSFAGLMSAIGLALMRLLIARPLAAAGRDAVALRSITRCFALALALALVAIPIYVLQATAQFALRSSLDLADVIPLMGSSELGRGWLTLELVLALFGFAAGAAIWLDRPERALRSVADLLALSGAAACAAAALSIPGFAGHAAAKSPRGLSVSLDWLHLAAASIWLGGLLGLVVLALRVPPARRVRALAVVVPRFSGVALVAVLLLVCSGIAQAIVRLPTLGSLWNSDYGTALLVKVGLVVAALVFAALNRLRSTPALVAAQGVTAPGAGAPARLLGRVVGVELALAAAALFAAAVLSSLPPPPAALSQISNVAARVGPGPVARTIAHGRYELRLRLAPNRAAAQNSLALSLTRDGRPVRSAGVLARFAMLDMEMSPTSYRLSERSPAVYANSSPALVMAGHWALSLSIRPPSASPFSVLVLDSAGG